MDGFAEAVLGHNFSDSRLYFINYVGISSKCSTLSSKHFRGTEMSSQSRNVQKPDVQSLDNIRGVFTKGFHRMVVRTRKIRLNFWTGSVAAEETVTTVEPSDARH
jgi:hypothetical protein